MKLTPITVLVPGVRPTGERNVFEVKSRSKDKWWRVDGECKHGLCQCDCYDYRMNKNQNCFHIQQVRKFVTVAVMQACLTEKPKSV